MWPSSKPTNHDAKPPYSNYSLHPGKYFHSAYTMIAKVYKRLLTAVKLFRIMQQFISYDQNHHHRINLADEALNVVLDLDMMVQAKQNAQNIQQVPYSPLSDYRSNDQISYISHFYQPLTTPPPDVEQSSLSANYFDGQYEMAPDCFRQVPLGCHQNFNDISFLKPTDPLLSLISSSDSELSQSEERHHYACNSTTSQKKRGGYNDLRSEDFGILPSFNNYRQI